MSVLLAVVLILSGVSILDAFLRDPTPTDLGREFVFSHAVPCLRCCQVCLLEVFERRLRPQEGDEGQQYVALPSLDLDLSRNRVEIW
jgi:hypothetical protein